MPFTMTGGPYAPFPSRIDSSAVSIPTWYVSDGVCALADSRCHLGHTMLEGDFWVAYDAVHPNAFQNGFLALGLFKTVSEAAKAIEGSVGVSQTQVMITPNSS